MSQRTTGWTLFAGALGMMLGLLAPEIQLLGSWQDATSTAFIGSAAGHLAAVLIAFAGGKLLPTIERWDGEERRRPR